jgi:hypothetical protein
MLPNLGDFLPGTTSDPGVAHPAGPVERPGEISHFGKF